MLNKFQNILRLVADSPEQLRISDIVRILDEAEQNKCLQEFVNWILNQSIPEKCKIQIKELIRIKGIMDKADKKMSNTVYHKIYNKLNKLTISEGGIVKFTSTPGNTLKLKSGGFMDLSIECLYDGRISMTHYYTSNGDLIPDPDMEIRINSVMGIAEAMTYQDSFGYQEVYVNGGKQYYPKLKKSLNSFLNTWLGNLKKQGFYK